MDKYELQSYFEQLCDIYYAARMNAKRVGVEEGQATNDSDEYWVQYWNTRAWNEFVEISSHITLMVRNRCQIIVTKKQEAFALIYYSAREYPSWQNVLNTEEVHLIDYPDDEMSKEYFEAYKAQDINKMKELRDKYC